MRLSEKGLLYTISSVLICGYRYNDEFLLNVGIALLIVMGVAYTIFGIAGYDK